MTMIMVRSNLIPRLFLWYMSLKIDAAIWNTFLKCVCGASPPQTGRLFPQIGRLLPQIGRLLPRIVRFLPKTRKASSEECWVRTHICFRNAVQLHLRIFQSGVCVFRAAFVMEKQNSNGKVRKRTSFLKMHTVPPVSQ